jgi:hypothetical protein
MSRITAKLSPADFKSQYWLKKELIAFCREKGINTSGGKIEITERILAFLQNDEIIKKPTEKSRKKQSKFDWNGSTLTPGTIITDNYKNTEQVRNFFKKHIGDHFRFNTEFMAWMKDNVGLTLQDAVKEWERLSVTKRDKNNPSEIAPQFEYNQFIRDYFRENPGRTLHDAISEWQIKRGINQE